MLTIQQLYDYLPYTFGGVELPFLGDTISGKVRDNYRVGDKRVLITTDRLSAFDRILGLVPFKGQVLNQLAGFDAVLGAVAAEYLYSLDPEADEGQLTRRRVALVRAETLVRWAREIDLGSYLCLGAGERPGEGARDRMLAGGFEAGSRSPPASPG